MPLSTKSSSRFQGFNWNPVNYLAACKTRREVLARRLVVQQELDTIQAQYEAEVEALKCLEHDLTSTAGQQIVSLEDYRGLRELVEDAKNIGGKVMDEECGLRNELAVLEARLTNINKGIKLTKAYFRNEKRKVVSFEGFRSQAEGT